MYRVYYDPECLVTKNMPSQVLHRPFPSALKFVYFFSSPAT
jgi:hypothetical protein